MWAYGEPGHIVRDHQKSFVMPELTHMPFCGAICFSALLIILILGIYSASIRCLFLEQICGGKVTARVQPALFDSQFCTFATALGHVRCAARLWVYEELLGNERKSQTCVTLRVENFALFTASRSVNTETWVFSFKTLKKKHLKGESQKGISAYSNDSRGIRSLPLVSCLLAKS